MANKPETGSRHANENPKVDPQPLSNTEKDPDDGFPAMR
jgi:hypothetical protein